MTEEEKVEQNLEVAVSEQPEGEQQDEQGEQKMVPLSAMLATREKLRDAENRALKAEAAAQAYQDSMKLKGEVVDEPELHPNSLIERKELMQNTMTTKREILETLYQDMNPEAVQKINLYLKPILEKKPWLAQSVDTAQNRYARAYEIVQDYMHLVDGKSTTAKKSAVSDGQRIVQNANKPGSPMAAGKSAQPQGVEFLKSIQGKAEFREYRQKVLQGRA